MRLLSITLTFVLVAIIGCTSELPTSDLTGEVTVSHETVFAKSIHAAGVFRGERNLFLWFEDPATGMEFDFFDPAVLCTEGFDAAVQRRTVQWVIKEELDDDPDDPLNDRLLRVQSGDDIVAVASPAVWQTCEEWFGWRDAGQVDYGTADVHSTDNDVFGYHDRQHANAWHWTGHGQLMTSGGEYKRLNFVDQCVWLDETDDSLVRCHSNFVYK